MGVVRPGGESGLTHHGLVWAVAGAEHSNMARKGTKPRENGERRKRKSDDFKQLLGSEVAGFAAGRPTASPRRATMP